MPTLADVRKARDRISPYVRPTTLYRYASLDELVGAEVFVEHENYLSGRLLHAAGLFSVQGTMRARGREPGRGCVHPRSRGRAIEAAGAAPLAAALRLRERLSGRRVALIASGGNVSTEQLRELLAA